MAKDTASPAILRSPLGRVRGLGSAKGGTHHWWMQRISSLALLPLTIWFAVSAVTFLGTASYAQAAEWVALPWNAVLLLALILVSFQHTASGLQVVVEDYVRGEFRRRAYILLIDAICFLLALASALAVLRLAL